jgi:hypothetical protein
VSRLEDLQPGLHLAGVIPGQTVSVIAVQPSWARRSAPGVTLNVTIEIEATTPNGFDDAKARMVSENAATLKFEQSGFEDQ